MKLFVLLFLLFACCVPTFEQTHQHGTTPVGDGSFNPFVVSGDRGEIYFVYIERTKGENNVMFRQSEDGKAFSDPVRVNDRPGDAAVRNENPPKVAVSRKGDVYVCWANERARWKGDIRFARSTDRGRTFLPSVTVNSDTGVPVGRAFQSIAIDSQGRVYVDWIDERNKKQSDRGAEIWMSISDDGGRSFTPDRKILSDVCECCRTTIQCDSAGRLFLSYRTVPRQGPMYRDILIAVSADRGKGFKTSVVSHDNWDINACPVAGPGMSVDARGLLTVIWFTAGGDRPGLYYVYSSDHGSSFSSRRMLDANQRMGKHAQVASVSADEVAVAWEDSTDKPFLKWGVLRPITGGLQIRGQRAEASYPVIAVNGKLMIVAGQQQSASQTFIETYELKRSE